MEAPTEKQLNDPKWWDENAPEGATHYRAPGGMYYGGFYKREPDGEWYFFVDAQWEFLEKPEKSAAHPLTPRPPKPEPQEWSGGFPKVHADCLMTDGDGVLVEVLIISWVDGYVVGWCADREQVYFSKDPEDFRPIRTQAERERDELAEVIAKAATMKLAVVLDPGHYDIIADAILSKYNLTPRGE